MYIAIKIAAVLLMIGCLVVAVLTLYPHAVGFPVRSLLWIRLWCGIVAIIALIALLIRAPRDDLAPDYLASLYGSYFNRDGFSFVVLGRCIDNVFHFEVVFQSQYVGACSAVVKLVTSGRGSNAPYCLQIACPAAGFGVARLPVAVPQAAQGFDHRFKVYADVKYEERGEQVRFVTGGSVGASGYEWLHRSITVVLLFTGAAYIHSTANTTISVPHGVATELPANAAATCDILWQLNDPVDSESMLAFFNRDLSA